MARRWLATRAEASNFSGEPQQKLPLLLAFGIQATEPQKPEAQIATAGESLEELLDPWVKRAKFLGETLIPKAEKILECPPVSRYARASGPGPRDRPASGWCPVPPASSPLPLRSRLSLDDLLEGVGSGARPVARCALGGTGGHAGASERLRQRSRRGSGRRAKSKGSGLAAATAKKARVVERLACSSPGVQGLRTCCLAAARGAGFPPFLPGGRRAPQPRSTAMAGHDLRTQVSEAQGRAATARRGTYGLHPLTSRTTTPSSSPLPAAPRTPRSDPRGSGGRAGARGPLPVDSCETTPPPRSLSCGSLWPRRERRGPSECRDDSPRRRRLIAPTPPSSARPRAPR